MTSTSDCYHVPVLLTETIEALAVDPRGTYVDLTAGGGAHSAAILKRLGQGGRLLASDRDDDAVRATTAHLERITTDATWAVNKATFDDALSGMIRDGVIANGLLADLGVSSHQLDEAERGYSYHNDGPLDMRMDRSQALTAATLVNTWPVERLADLLATYGEERYARKVACAIDRRRRMRPFTRTLDLAEVVTRAMPPAARREAQHPARRTFQAIRMAVNDEQGQLIWLLDHVLDVMAPGGRLAILTFHSIEDRLVKRAMAQWAKPCTCPRHRPCVCGAVAKGCVLSRGGVTASAAERKANRRATCARLRVFEVRESEV